MNENDKGTSPVKKQRYHITLEPEHLNIAVEAAHEKFGKCSLSKAIQLILEHYGASVLNWDGVVGIDTD